MSAAPDPTANAACLPPRVRALGNALREVAATIRQHQGRRVAKGEVLFDRLQAVGVHLDRQIRALREVEEWIRELSDSVVARESANETDAWRAAGRIEQIMASLVADHHEVLATRPAPGSEESRLLMLGTYRFYLKTLMSWIDHLVRVIDDPMAEARKQGKPLSGDVVLTVNLKMRPAPQMDRLDQIARELQPPQTQLPPVRMPFAPEPYRPGLLATLGAVAFGLSVARSGFRRRHW